MIGFPSLFRKGVAIGFVASAFFACKVRSQSQALADTQTERGGEDLTTYKAGGPELNEDERTAIRLYTSEQVSDEGIAYYKTLNNALRSGNSSTVENNLELIHNIASGVNKSRTGGCHFYRFLSANQSLVEQLSTPGTVFVERGFFSSTELSNGPPAFGGLPYRISGTSGNCAHISSLSTFPAEQEILFPPGTAFEVTQRPSGNTFFVREAGGGAVQSDSSSAGSIATSANDDEFQATLREFDKIAADIRKTQEETKKILEKLRY